MTQRKTIAERMAREILKKFGSELPTAVEKIARDCGIRVEKLPLDDELSGMSFVKDGAAVIVVNMSHHPNRQRFTIAHELGHHILHKDYLINNVHVDKAVLRRDGVSSRGTESKEVEANAFAAELLMPLSQVEPYRDVDINDEGQLIEVARKFKVSTSAIAIRISNI